MKTNAPALFAPLCAPVILFARCQGVIQPLCLPSLPAASYVRGPVFPAHPDDDACPCHHSPELAHPNREHTHTIHNACHNFGSPEHSPRRFMLTQSCFNQTPRKTSRYFHLGRLCVF